jgi:5-methylcytosine-specific restriction protein A
VSGSKPGYRSPSYTEYQRQYTIRRREYRHAHPKERMYQAKVCAKCSIEFIPQTGNARYCPSCRHEGYAANVKAYRRSAKGRIYINRQNARRRGRSEQFGDFFITFHRQRTPCNVCGGTYKTTHQVDHIQPIRLGGDDSGTNLQMLCLSCHRAKTRNDLSEIWKVRRWQSIFSIS